MSLHLRGQRRDSAKEGSATAGAGDSPLTVMDVDLLGSTTTASTTKCTPRPKRSPPSSELIDSSASVVEPNKRFRSLLATATPSPSSLVDVSFHGHGQGLVSSNDASVKAATTHGTARRSDVSVLVTPACFSPPPPPTLTASSISMTSSWWSSTLETSLTNFPPTSPLRSAKKIKRNNILKPLAARPNGSVRTDDLQLKPVAPEGSIGRNAQDYYRLIKKSPNQIIGMKEAANKLGIKVRRIYDVTNVLEGVGLVSRCNRQEMSMQLCAGKGDAATAKKKKVLQNELDDLEREEAQLDEWIQFLQSGMNSEHPDKNLNHVPVSDLLQLSPSNGSSVVIAMQPGAAVHRGAHGRSNCSFSVRAPPSGFGPSGSMTAFVLEGGSKKLRPLLLTYPPLLTTCSSDFTEHALQDFTNYHKRHNTHDTTNSSNYQQSELSQLSQQSDFGDVDDKDRILINDAASTLACMAVMFSGVEHSPLTANATRPFCFWPKK